MNRNETNDDAIREGEPPYSANTDYGGRTRPITFGVVCVLAPFVGITLSIPFGLLVVWASGAHGAALVKPSASFFAASVVVGLLSGCMALARSERMSGMSIVALAVNAAILALLVYWDPWSGPF